MLLECDKCKHQFKPKIREKKVNDTAAKTYFACNNCKEEYLINYTNQSIKAKQREIRKVQKDYAALSGKRNIKGSKSLFNRCLKLKKAIEKEMNELKVTIEAAN